MGLSEEYEKAKKQGLKLMFRGKFLSEVINPKGTLAALWIVQTGRPGFTVLYRKPPHRTLSYGHHKAELLALRLAKKGHKSVLLD